MADPVLTAIPASTWVKVVDNKFSAKVTPSKRGPEYVFTTRDAGSTPAPTNGDLSEGEDLPQFGGELASPIAQDVYVAIKPTTLFSGNGQVKVVTG
jgi:hypothetical protein